MQIHEARKKIRQLLDDTDPAESPVAYYALFHPTEKSQLAVHLDESERVQGFVGRFLTGADLFRPLVTLKCQNPAIAADLMTQTLVPGRPYILFANINQLPMVGGSLHVDNQRILRIYVIDPRRFRPEVNVLVQHKTAPDGTPRCEIHSDGYQAVAGVNWKSPGFAEIYVHTDLPVRRQGWGRSVTVALTERLLKDGIRPVYLVDNHNEASRELIESLGYVDSGSRQVYADTVYTGHPAQNGG